MAHRGYRKRAGRDNRKANVLRGRAIVEVRKLDADRYRDKSGVIGGIDGASKFHHEALVSETVKTHVIPRQSVTRKQLLNITPVDDATIFQSNGRQLLKQDDGKGNLIPVVNEKGNYVMVPFSNNVVVKTAPKATKSLLIPGNPFAEARDLKRQHHYSKRIEHNLNRDLEKVEDHKADMMLDLDELERPTKSVSARVKLGIK